MRSFRTRLFLMIVAAVALPARSPAQTPSLDLSVGWAEAFSGGGPMATATMMPFQFGPEGGIRVGLGISGWFGRLANAVHDFSHRKLSGVGPRLEIQVPLEDGSIIPFVRLGRDWAKSAVIMPSDVWHPPGNRWDERSANGISTSVEVGALLRFKPKFWLQVVGGLAHQSIYEGQPNPMWKFGVGVAAAL
jgi:hypothetical protein